MPAVNRDSVISVLGKRGTGKTLLVKHLANKISVNVPVYVFDIVHNWNEFPQLTAPIKLKEFLKPGIRVVKEIDRETFYNFTRDIYFTFFGLAGKAHCFVIFDEIYLKVTNGTLDSWENEFFKKLLIVGRNYGVGMICTAQRPAILNKSVLSLSAQIFSFRLTMQSDLDAVEEFFPDNEPKKAEPFHFFEYSDTSDKIKYYNPIDLKSTQPRKEKAKDDAK